MALINFQQREIAVKIVYYGPAFSGKTTNVRKLHELIPNKLVGGMTTLDTEDERTLFFDYFPVKAGAIGRYKLKLQIFSVPGQVHYRTTRRVVLQNADGVVFVADSQAAELDHNLSSLRDMEENLRSYGVDLEHFPLVLQYNKRDLPTAMPVETLDRKLNTRGYAYCEAVATDGKGVLEAFNGIVDIVTRKLRTELGRTEEGQALDAGTFQPTTPGEMADAKVVGDLVKKVAELGEHGEGDLEDILAKMGIQAQPVPTPAPPPKAQSPAPAPQAAPPPRAPAAPAPQATPPDLLLKRVESLPDGSFRAEFRGPGGEVRLRMVFRREQLEGLLPAAGAPPPVQAIPPYLLIIVFVWLAVITLYTLVAG